MKKIIMLLVFVSALTFGISASAQAYNVTFCFDWDKNFTDAGYGDYFLDNSSHQLARGVYVQIEERQGLFSWAVVEEGHALYDGCYDADLTYNNRYRITLFADSLIDSNHVKGINPDYDDLHYQVVSSILGFNLTSNYYEFVYNYLTAHKTSNVMAVGTRAMTVARNGVNNDTIYYITEEPPSGGCGGYSDGDRAVRTSSTCRDEKFVIAHETGHFFNYAYVGHTGIYTGCDSYNNPVYCPSSGSHSWHSQENQGCAAKEGFANFYSALLFNTPSLTTCDYGSNDCVTMERYLFNYCHPNPYLIGYFDALGVESDWTQFYWNLYSNHADVQEDWQSPAIFASLWEDTAPWDDTHMDVYENFLSATTTWGGNYEDDFETIANCNSHACVGW